MKEGLDKLELEIEKLNSKYEKVIEEVRAYQSKIDNAAYRRISKVEKEKEALVKEVEGFRAVFLRGTNEERESYLKLTDPDNWYITDDNDELLFVKDSTELKIASTISILNVLVEKISSIYPSPMGKSEGFERISFSILYPLIYANLGKESSEDLYLYKLPNGFDEVVRLGREFHIVLDKGVSGHLSHAENWSRFSGRIVEWWVDEMLPLVYDGREIHFSGVAPYTFEQMRMWSESREDRGLDFGEVYDAVNTSNKYLGRVISENGLKEFNNRVELGHFDFPTVSVEDLM